MREVILKSKNYYLINLSEDEPFAIKEIKAYSIAVIYFSCEDFLREFIENILLEHSF